MQSHNMTAENKETKPRARGPVRNAKAMVANREKKRSRVSMTKSENIKIDQVKRRAAAVVLATVTKGNRAMHLEGTPVPVTRNGGSDLASLAHSGLGILCIHVLGDRHANLLSIDGGLDLVQTVGAVLFPALVGAPAQVAGTGGDTIGVEASILIKGNEVRCVGGAEDMTAVTTVVTTEKDAE